jgi:hypothetical protein
MAKTKPKPEVPNWTQTRLQLAVCWVKSAVGASVMLGIVALGALLYLAFMAFLSHHLPRWLP